MTQWLKQSTAVTLKLGPFVDSTDGFTAETGLTISQADVRLSKNGGNIAQKNEATSATHDELGVYDVPIDATDTDTLGRLDVHVQESGALPVFQSFMVVPQNVWDSMFGTDKLQTDAVEISSDSAAADNLELFTEGTALGTLPKVNAHEVAGAAPETGADIAADVWDESLAGHVGAGSAGATVSDILTDTGTTLDGKLDTIDTNVDSILVDTAVIGAAGAGLTAVPWNASWDAEVQSEVADALAVYDPPTHAELVSEINAVQADIAALENLTAAEVNAEVDTALADIHLDHLLATDYDPAAKPGTATALLNELVESDGGVSRFTANALEQGPSGGSAPTVAEIVDGVWDEAIAGHVGAGSTGEALSAAGGAGDPWITALPGAYGAGSAGKIIGDNLNATVSSRATPAQVQAELVTYDAPTFAELDARTDAIEADTQDIQSRLPAALVSGRMSSDAVAISGSTAAADSVESSIGNLDATVSSRATPAQVNAEVVDALTVDTYAEPAAVPAATSSLKDKILWLFTLARNRITQTATTQTVRNDADNATIATSTVSDDATTAVRGEYT